MTEVRPVYTTVERQSGRLIDIVNHLPAGVVLTASPAFQEIVGHPLIEVSILQACDAVIAAGYQNDDAAIKGHSIILARSGGPYVVFTVRHPESGQASPEEEQVSAHSSEGELVPFILSLDVKQLSKTAPLFSEKLGQLLKELESPVAWLKVSNLRLEAESLSHTFKRIDGLL